MSDTLKVTTGPNAYVFHDQNTGITVSKGEVVELNNFQRNSKRVIQALNSGHLTRVESAQVSSKKDIAERMLALRDKFVALHTNGKTPDKIASAFSQDELKDLANHSDLTIEPGDTKLAIVAAIIEAINEEE